jgi:protein gp37
LAKETKISWCTSTHNPWIGCTKVSPGCDNCYAETLAHRFGLAVWGVHAERKRTRTETWAAPLKWNRAATKSGKQHLVFAASMADIFDNQVPTEWRDDFWELVRRTQSLTWIILTKRPQNFRAMLPSDWADGYPNVWLGVSVENQIEADRRIPILRGTPAALRLLSVEPMLELIELGLPQADAHDAISWVIVGGESGSNRAMTPDMARSIRDQTLSAGVHFFMKQRGSGTAGWPPAHTAKGESPEEWPEDLRIQSTPQRVIQRSLAAA